MTKYTLQTEAADVLLRAANQTYNRLAAEPEWRREAAELDHLLWRWYNRKDKHPENKLVLSRAELERLLDEASFALDVGMSNSAAAQHTGAIIDKIFRQIGER